MVMLFQTTGRLGTIPGGVKRQWEILGFDHSNDPTPDLSGYEAVIISNCEDQSVIQAQNCIKQGVRFAWIPYGWKKRDQVLGRDSSHNAEFLQTHASWVITQSRAEKDDMGDNRAVVIPPAVDDAFYNMNIERTIVHTNGRYDKFKRQEFVLEVCDELNIPCTTAGYPQDEAYFKACQKHNGTVLGLLQPDELNKIYNQTRVYVCASTSECNSGSVHEAVACGCCVLADGRNHYGIQELIYPGVRMYFSDGECKQLLHQLYNNPEPQKNTVVYGSVVRKMFTRLIGGTI